LPYIVNYSKKEHKAHDQNWCIVEDSLGLIYVGNHTGLLVFDGLEFDFVLSVSAINALAKDEKGTQISFEPLPEVFGRSKWDLDILKTSLIFKQRLVQ
jgi:hypothetical protein